MIWDDLDCEQPDPAIVKKLLKLIEPGAGPEVVEISNNKEHREHVRADEEGGRR